MKKNAVFLINNIEWDSLLQLKDDQKKEWKHDTMLNYRFYYYL